MLNILIGAFFGVVITRAFCHRSLTNSNQEINDIRHQLEKCQSRQEINDRYQENKSRNKALREIKNQFKE